MADQSPTDHDDNLWSSPAATPAPPRTPKTSTYERRDDDDSDHEVPLRKELEGLKAINVSVEGIIQTLENTRSNMGIVSSTIGDASTLLNTWTRILSQTEHNQRLILDTDWQGSTQDLAQAQAEELRRKQAAERRAQEEDRRREEVRRRAQEEEQRRQAGVSSAGEQRGRRGSVRGRGRGTGRATTASSSSRIESTVGSSTQAEGGVVRSRSIIGRGVARYRPRGSRG